MSLLSIVVGLKKEERAAKIAEMLAYKDNAQKAKILRGYTTDTPADDADRELFYFIDAEQFNQMEKNGELIHVDQLGEAKYGYRTEDVKASLEYGHTVILFNQYVEQIDRPLFGRFRGIKMVLDRNGQVIKQSYITPKLLG
ncbi:MAG: hypothetical protein V1738_01145 [Patescibacteria group bacterium]